MRDQTEGASIPLKAGGVESARRRTFEAAVCYFMAILTVSWVLGPIREFFTRGGSDPLLGALSQGAATLLLLIYAAGWVVRTFSVPARIGYRIGVGLGGVGLFLACDGLSAYLLLGWGPADLAAGLITPQGLAIDVTLLVAAVLPAVLNRSGEV